MKPYDRNEPQNGKDLDQDIIAEARGEGLDEGISDIDDILESLDIEQGASKNQGEGDRIAARRYDAGVQEFVAQGRVEGAARDAASAVDGPEGPSLRAAEEAGKSRSKMSPIETIIGVGRAFIGGAKAAFREARAGRSKREQEPERK